MKIGFIGAGKVGTSFGAYLYKKGFNVIGYYSRTFNSAENAIKYSRGKAFNNIKDLAKLADMIFITTNDDNITKVCQGLVQEDCLKEGQVLIHMSGASSSRALKSAKKKGCSIYSMHPLQAFASVERAVKDLENTVFSIEGDGDRIHLLEEILKTTGNKYFKLTSQQKTIYHATACVVSNYLVTLMDYGLSLFESIGIEKNEGYKALYPLIEGTIKNIYSLGTDKALTGPIARGDIQTIEKHLKSLEGTASNKTDFYKIMGAMTLEIAKKEKLKDTEKIRELEDIFRL